MPIYEYDCESCGADIELLVRSKDDRPSCPRCGKDALHKRFSAFAVKSGSERTAPQLPPMGACGRCGDPRGPGACAMGGA